MLVPSEADEYCLISAENIGSSSLTLLSSEHGGTCVNTARVHCIPWYHVDMKAQLWIVAVLRNQRELILKKKTLLFGIIYYFI